MNNKRNKRKRKRKRTFHPKPITTKIKDLPERQRLLTRQIIMMIVTTGPKEIIEGRGLEGAVEMIEMFIDKGFMKIAISHQTRDPVTQELGNHYWLKPLAPPSWERKKEVYK